MDSLVGEDCQPSWSRNSRPSWTLMGQWCSNHNRITGTPTWGGTTRNTPPPGRDNSKPGAAPVGPSVSGVGVSVPVCPLQVLLMRTSSPSRS
ncbi:hypothetical protein [Actinomyces ruminis]|uniref:hypothetical protein n=1 Tax=Actinomyces ruminis TaxID=1937003 RepID=UPI0015D4A5C2|nr:hypothetical protein [Actinomyces ruminis]